MNFLIVGSGGREHAIAKALSKDAKVFAVPGSDAIAMIAKCKDVSMQNFGEISELCSEQKIDCVVVGPEVPLAEGLTDFLTERGFKVFGPSREASQLEASKVFSKNFMIRAGVPTARSWTVSNVSQTMDAASHTHPPYVLKADGLASGKGVFICKTLVDLGIAARDIFELKTLGDAGACALLEEFSAGYELSYLVLTNGSKYEALPLAQDHKRLRDKDEGPNTGGMGTVAPMHISAELDREIRETVFDRVMSEIKKQKFIYRGVLFVGLMITSHGPSVLEFNVRFGDPETQVILPLLDGSWSEVFLKVAQGEIPKLKWHTDLFASCVVLAAENYPDTPKRNVLIEGIADNDETRYILHAGTRKSNDGWLTNGGRVLNAIGLGATRAQSRERAYDLVDLIRSQGIQYRKDIGLKA